MANLALKQLDFVCVASGHDHKLELVRVTRNPLANYCGLPSQQFVLLLPNFGQAMVGGGIAELGAERREIAGNAIGRNGGSSFNRDMFAGGAERGGKFADALGIEVSLASCVSRVGKLAAMLCVSLWRGLRRARRKDDN